MIPFRTLDVTSSSDALGVAAIFSTVLAILLCKCDSRSYIESTAAQMPSQARTSDRSDSDFDIDDRQSHVVIVMSFVPIAEPPPPDVRTRKYIAPLTTPAHLASLLARSRTSLLALSNIWPCVLGSVLAASPGLMRELYRDYVRSNPLGREGTDAEVLADLSNTETWAPMLVLVNLYTKVLMTIGDDELPPIKSIVEFEHDSDICTTLMQFSLTISPWPSRSMVFRIPSLIACGR